jgi:hypothetical protein
LLLVPADNPTRFDMLSFLYRLIRGFQREHGFPPNAVYMSPLHYRALCENLSGLPSESIEAFLGVNLVIEPTATHPHAAWQDSLHRRRAAGPG